MATSPPHGAVAVHLNAMKNASLIWATEAPSHHMSENMRKLLALEETLSVTFRSKREEFNEGREDGQFVAVKSVENDTKWQRGKILHSFHQLQGIKYQVDLIDYGTQVRAKPAHLRTLPKDLIESLPPQAMLIQLYGIVPLSMRVDWVADRSQPGISEQWTPAAEKFVDDVLKSCHKAFFVEKKLKLFEGSAVKIRYGDLLVCVNGESQLLLSVSEELCSRHFAVKNEEEFLKREQVLHNVSFDRPEPCNSISLCNSSPEVDFERDLSSSKKSPMKKVHLLTDYISDRERKHQELDSSSSQEQAVATESTKAGNGLPSATEDYAMSQDEKKMSGSSASEEVNAPKSKKSNPLAAMLGVLRAKSSAGSSVSEVNKGVRGLDISSKRSTTTVSVSSSVNNESSSPKHGPEEPLEKKNPISPTESAIKNPNRVQTGRKPLESTQITFLPAGRNVVPPKDKSWKVTLEEFPINGRRQKQQPAFASDSDTSDSGMTHWRPKDKVRHEGGSGSDTSSGSSFSRPRNGSQRAGEYDSEAGSSDASIPRAGAHRASNRVAHQVNNQLSTSSSHSSSSRNATPGDSRLRPERSSIRSEEVRCEEQFLTRRVLLHGGLPPRPWMSYNDAASNFSEHVVQILNHKKWLHNAFTVQKFMWPAVLSRQNIVMVSGPGTGKTTSFLFPLMDFMCDSQPPPGNGPLVLILCGGCKAAEEIHEECSKLVKGSKSKVRVLLAYGLVMKDDFMVDLMNGCEVLVTTPSWLLRIMGKRAMIMNLRRLCHLVLDQADILFVKCLDQMKQIQARVIAEQKRRTEEDDPIQIIVSSEKWVPQLLSFTSHLRSNPIVFINDCLEAAVYGKATVKLHAVNSIKKSSYLVDYLNNHMKVGMLKTVVVCNTEEEVNHLEKFFENACFPFLVMKPSYTLVQVETCIQSYTSSCDGQHYLLLCTDADISELHIQDAMCLIHYSLPPIDKHLFKHRLSLIMNNLKNMFENENNFSPPQVHVLLDEKYHEPVPVIVQFMQRLGEEVDENILKLAKDASREKEKKKVNKPLCSSVKMFGDCWDKSSCPNRHILVPELDSPNGLPNCGEVTMKILTVHNACHFSVRILEYTNEEGAVQKWSSDYLKIAIKMSQHFARDENRALPPEVQIGNIYAVETATNLYQRVRVLNIVKRDQRNKPLTVEVQFLDDGHVHHVKTFMLYSLPESLSSLKPQAIDLFVCRLVPCDGDVSWNEVTNNCVRKWVKTNELDEENSKIFKGQIVFSLNGALWVDPLNILKLLPYTEAYVIVRNIRQSLLQDQHAFENPGHLQKLYAMCAGHSCFILPPNVLKSVQSIAKRPPPQPKPAWAFLETECFNAVDFSAADSSTCFFVRRRKFSSLLQKIIRDIGNEVEQSKNKEISVLESGYICLARHSTEGIWHRAQVLGISEDGSVNVFYVDYGDRDELNRQDIIAIPDWAITRLPFQAIECSMAGISSCSDINTLYDITEDGAKLLQAKVCEKSTSAECTGGSRYVVTLVDCSSSGPTVLNKDLLARNDITPLEEQLKYLDLDLDACRKVFETSFDEASDSESEDENELPLSRKQDNILLDNTAFEPSYIETAGVESSDADNILPEIDDHFIINGYRVDCHEFDPEPLFEFLQGSKPKAPLALPVKTPLKSISHHSNDDQSECSPLPEKKSGKGQEHHEFAQRVTLPLLSSARPPQVKWYEDLYHVWVKVCITGMTSYFLRWNVCHIQFSSSVNGKCYHFDQELRGSILPRDLITSTTGFCLQMKLRKACSGVLWERLFSSNRKYAWVSKDLDADAMGSSDESDGDIHPTVEAFNRGVRKLPINQRRRRRRLKDGPALPDDSENDSGCSDDAEFLDPDLMF